MFRKLGYVLACCLAAVISGAAACGAKVVVDETGDDRVRCADIEAAINAACPGKPCGDLDEQAEHGICVDTYHDWMGCLAEHPASPCTLNGPCLSAEHAWTQCTQTYCAAHAEDVYCPSW